MTVNNYFKLIRTSRVEQIITFDDADPEDVDRALALANHVRNELSGDTRRIVYRLTSAMDVDPRFERMRATLPCPRHRWTADKKGGGSVCKRCAVRSEIVLEVLAVMPP